MANAGNDYIAGLTPLRAERAGRVRALAHAVRPDLTQSIEWKMPVFRSFIAYIAVASQKHYVSVHLGCLPLAAQVLASDR